MDKETTFTIVSVYINGKHLFFRIMAKEAITTWKARFMYFHTGQAVKATTVRHLL